LYKNRGGREGAGPQCGGVNPGATPDGAPILGIIRLPVTKAGRFFAEHGIHVTPAVHGGECNGKGFGFMRKLLAAGFVFAALALPAAAHAQGGAPGGAVDGFHKGDKVAGPIGGVIGAAVGGIVGGLVGGVSGVLGIPQPGADEPPSPRRRHHHRRYDDR
jgi:hypothetical protein